MLTPGRARATCTWRRWSPRRSWCCWRWWWSPTGRWCGPIPSGGGSYEVASRNLGRSAGLVVAAALLVDYVMTVAVSVAAGVDNIISAVPSLNPHRVAINVGFVLLLTAMNLRGVRESGRRSPSRPTCSSSASCRDDRARAGPDRVRRRAGGRVAPAGRSHAEHAGLAGLALLFLALRAFASGCTALTGVEAISNGVPAFRPPKSENAARDHGRDGRRSRSPCSPGITALALIAEVRVRREHLRPGRVSRRLRDRPAAHRDRPARRGGVRRRRLGRVLLDPGHHRADPDPGREHRVQRVPAARPRSWPRTGTCRGSCTPAATGWRSPTASSCWRWSPAR